MTNETKIVSLIRQMIAEGTQPALIPCVVVSADTQKCVVKLTGSEVERDDVLLTATLENNEGVVIVPKEGTNALVGVISKDIDALVLLRCDHYKEVHITSEAGKLHIESNGVNLKTLLTQIVDAIETLTVSTPAGPSGTPLPPTLVKIKSITNDINRLFVNENGS